MMATGRMIRRMASAFIRIWMARAMKGIGRKINNMGMAWKLGLIMLRIRDSM